MKLKPGQTVSPAVAKLNPGVPLDKPAMTSYPAVPATPKNDAVTERKVHEQISQWLRLNDIFTVHSRMDQKTTNEKGTPDYMLAVAGVPVAFEVKVNGNILTLEQQKVRTQMIANGWRYFTVSDLQEVTDLVHAVKGGF